MNFYIVMLCLGIADLILQAGVNVQHASKWFGNVCLHTADFFITAAHRFV